jgi:transcriptional regulator with XRE-family HTH domain
VADWVELGTTVMKTARERLGLSYESVARQVPVSSKTYERYEKKGRVPRPLLPKIAGILQLEVEEPDRIRVTVEGDPAEVAQGELAALRTQLDRIETLLEEQLRPRQAKP